MGYSSVTYGDGTKVEYQDGKEVSRSSSKSSNNNSSAPSWYNSYANDDKAKGSYLSTVDDSSSSPTKINQGGHSYSFDKTGNIFKNGNFVPAENFKYLPSEVVQRASDMKRADTLGATTQKATPTLTVPQATQLTKGLQVPQVSYQQQAADEIQAQLDKQAQAINQALQRQLQSAQLSVEQNNSFLESQLGKLREEKTVTDDKTVNLQNRRGGFYSGGLDYQLGQNERAYANQQEALRQEIAQRNADIYSRNQMLAEQASEQISQLQQQAPTLIRQRINEYLDQQRQYAIQDAGLTGYYNGQPTMQMQGMQFDQQQSIADQQAKQQQQQLDQLWAASEMFGYVHPQLAKMLGIPEGTPTMDARKMVADQSWRSDQLSLDYAKLNQDAYQFNANQNNDNYWKGLEYDASQSKANQQQPLSASQLNGYVDMINKKYLVYNEDSKKYSMPKTEKNKQKAQDNIYKSILSLDLPDNQTMTLLQQYGLQDRVGFNATSKGDGRYTNLYKTKQASNSKTFNQFQNNLAQALDNTGVPASWAPYLTELFGRESSWDPSAKNPKSTAHGYAQFLNSTRSSYEKKYGIKYNTPVNQLILGIHYVKDRYGDPVKALKFWDKNNYY